MVRAWAVSIHVCVCVHVGRLCWLRLPRSVKIEICPALRLGRASEAWGLPSIFGFSVFSYVGTPTKSRKEGRKSRWCIYYSTFPACLACL